jgi:hypothetical protein
MTSPDFSRAERDRLELRLWNWSRWCLQDTGRAHSCASAEHLYRAPREDEEAFVRSAQEPVDVRDACKVEDAVLRLSTSRQTFLKGYFVYRSHPVALGRMFKLRAWQIVPALVRATRSEPSGATAGSCTWRRCVRLGSLRLSAITRESRSTSRCRRFCRGQHDPQPRAEQKNVGSLARRQQASSVARRWAQREDGRGRLEARLHRGPQETPASRSRH